MRSRDLEARPELGPGGVCANPSCSESLTRNASLAQSRDEAPQNNIHQVQSGRNSGHSHDKTILCAIYFLHLTISPKPFLHNGDVSPSNVPQGIWPAPPRPRDRSAQQKHTKPDIARSNITWHAGLTRDERTDLRKQKGATVWFTGLSASGKSTIAIALEQHLLHLGLQTYRLDGDNVRFGLNKDLGFSPKDREENIRRIAEVSPGFAHTSQVLPTDTIVRQVAKLFADSTTIALTSFISPYKADRQIARDLHAETKTNESPLPFIEVFIDIPVEEAEKRDPKGLYKKARSGEIKEFTGISAPYEAPEKAEIHIHSEKTSVEEAVKIITDYLQEKGLLKN